MRYEPLYILYVWYVYFAITRQMTAYKLQGMHALLHACRVSSKSPRVHLVVKCPKRYYTVCILHARNLEICPEFVTSLSTLKDLRRLARYGKGWGLWVHGVIVNSLLIIVRQKYLHCILHNFRILIYFTHAQNLLWQFTNKHSVRSHVLYFVTPCVWCYWPY